MRSAPERPCLCRARTPPGRPDHATNDERRRRPRRTIARRQEKKNTLTNDTQIKKNKGLRLDTDGWLREYDACKALIAEVVQLVQERNMNHPTRGGGGGLGGGGGGGGGAGDAEASRLTASARRKLGALGGSLDGLYAWLDGPEASEL